MNQRRVLLTTDVVGGVWDFSLVLASGIRSSSMVTLLAFGQPSAAQRETASGAGAELISAPLKLEWMREAEADVETTRRVVRDVARETKADLLHANQFAAACAEVDVPVVLTVHSDVMSWRKWSLRGAADVPDEWRAYYQLVREALQAADSVVAVSAFLANEMRAQYATDQRIDVIHNGWPATPDALVTFDANDRRGTLLAGRIWDEGKNIALAAEAAHGWDSGDVCLAGERAHPDGGVADVPSPLQPLGFLSRSELDARLRRSQVYLSTARYDPFGLLPLQAALNGCALLLSDIPSYREVWDGAAQFFGSDDVSDLRHQWRTLLQDGTRISNLRRRAYERATRAYTPRRMIDAYLGVYTRVRARAAA